MKVVGTRTGRNRAPLALRNVGLRRESCLDFKRGKVVVASREAFSELDRRGWAIRAETPKTQTQVNATAQVVSTEEEQE